MRALLAIAALAGLAGGAAANDTAATVGAGGLVFARTDAIRLASEDLYLSMDEVRVVYRFENLTQSDQPLLIAFPMPDITGDFHINVSYPTDDPDNIFGFSTTFDGEPVDARLDQTVFALGVNRTKDLQKLGVPLAPHALSTEEAVNALDEADKQMLLRLGLIASEEWGEGPYHYPIWTLKSAYVWEAVFPAGETVTVEHRYKPGIGGASTVSFLYDGEYSQRGEYDRKYCLDEPFVNAVRRSLADPEELWSAPYYENWLSYVLSTGANWAGPIGTFRLVVDKGRPENLVSFCGDGVTKTGPTTFELIYNDFWPWEDIEVLFLVRIDTD